MNIIQPIWIPNNVSYRVSGFDDPTDQEVLRWSHQENSEVEITRFGLDKIQTEIFLGT